MSFSYVYSLFIQRGGSITIRFRKISEKRGRDNDEDCIGLYMIGTSSQQYSLTISISGKCLLIKCIHLSNIIKICISDKVAPFSAFFSNFFMNCPFSQSSVSYLSRRWKDSLADPPSHRRWPSPYMKNPIHMCISVRIGEWDVIKEKCCLKSSTQTPFHLIWVTIASHAKTHRSKSAGFEDKFLFMGKVDIKLPDFSVISVQMLETWD